MNTYLFYGQSTLSSLKIVTTNNEHMSIMSRDTNKSSTVLRAFRVLEAVAENSRPVTSSGIAVQTGLERVTSYRMLRTLEEAGYVTYDEAGKTFQLSPRPLFLARGLMAQDATRDKIEAALNVIADRTGETCHYSELDGKETTLTQRAKGRQLVAVDFQIGTRCELHATSVGKAILAHRSAGFLETYLSGDLKKYTSETVTDPDGLRRQIAEIRQTGVSYDFEELSEGMNCVAVPIRSTTGQVLGGISISGPDSRLTRTRLKELSAIMKEEIARLEAQIR